MSLKHYFPVFGFIILAICLQQILAALGLSFLLGPLTIAAYYGIVLIGLSLLMGFTGQVSMGQAGFFGIGSYVQAVLVTLDLRPWRDGGFVALLDKLGLLLTRKDIYGEEVLNLSPWLALLLALGLTALIALILGLPVLRLKGHYLAMATLGFGIIVHSLVYSVKLFGLSDGISGVPEFSLGPGLVISSKLTERVSNFYLALGALVLVIILAINLVNSRVGRALRALHGNEFAASSVGINTSSYKLYTFIISAVLAALGGALLVHFNGMIGPSSIDVMKSVRLVALVAAGGMDSIWGVVYMGFILNFISLRQVFGSFDDIFFAMILIILMLFLPQGLIRASYFAKLFQHLKIRLKTLKQYFWSRLRLKQGQD